MLRSIFVTIAALAAVSCSSPAEVDHGTPDPELLARSVWQLDRVSADGDTKSARALLTVDFESVRRFGGSAGPNVYGGVYTANRQGTIQFDSVVTTLIGGEEADRAGEYLLRLGRADRYSVSETELWLYDGKGYLKFVSTRLE